jgi:cytochrome c-type biogenesis protein CcmE
VTTAPPVGWAPARAAPPGGVGPPAVPPSSAPPEKTSHRLRYVVVGAVLLGALVFLLAKGLGSALNFYLPADQAVAQRAKLGTQTFNLEGVVKPGSVHDASGGVDFVVTSGSASVQVDNSTSPPQLFQANIPVIAVGHFHGSAFVSDQILVKHSSNYIAAHPGRITAPNGSKR